MILFPKNLFMIIIRDKKTSLHIQLAQVDKAKWDLITVFNIIRYLFI